MKKKTIRTGGKKTPGLLFQGEMMKCAVCGKEQKSDFKIESGWTAITVDSAVYYFCPNCFSRYWS